MRTDREIVIEKMGRGESYEEDNRCALGFFFAEHHMRKMIKIDKTFSDTHLLHIHMNVHEYAFV